MATTIIAPGYHLTWHTYGTWLHGDPAGSVDLLHNTFGTPRLGPDPARMEEARRRMKHPPLTLAPTHRILVDNIMRRHCRIRAWDLRALAVRSNHVHVVIASPTIDPETIVKQRKEWGTRKLRDHRIIGMQQRAWVDHASTQYLYEPGALEEKAHYVLHMQGNPPPGHGRREP
jgi:REP element-mobilizing transposase RayT